MTYLADISTTVRFVEYAWILSRMGRGPNRILDIGCWDSMFPVMLASLGNEVTGVDMRDYPYEHPQFKFLKGDVRTDEIINQLGRYEVVTLVSVLEHVGLGNKIEWEADQSLLRMIAFTLLEDYGSVYVTVPCGMPKLVSREPGGPPWFRVYSRKSLDLLAIRADLTIKDVEYFAQKGSHFEMVSEEYAITLQTPDVASVARAVACVEFS